MAKKILVLAPRFYSYGGVPRVLTQLIPFFSDIEDIELEIITSRKDEKWSDQLSADITKISPYPHPYLAFYRKKVRDKAREADLIWSHHQTMIRPLFGINTPVIMTFHTLGKLFTGFINPLASFKFRMESFMAEHFMRDLQFADRVVAISKYSAQQLSQDYKSKPVKIYHGGDFQSPDPVNTDKGFIFCPDQIDQTVKRIAKKYKVKAIGDGEGSNIDYLGSLSDSELVEKYKKCSFVLTTSGREGFGLSPVEAAFYAKPSVARSVGGHKEIIEHGETGFLAENSKEFYQYVERLWKNEETRKQMGEKAYERANDKFTWKRAAKEYLTEFNDLMGESFSLQ